MEGRESVVVTVTGGGGGAGEVEPLHPLLPSETPPTPIPVSSSTTTSLSPPPVPATSSPSPLAPPPVAEGGSVLTSMPSSDVKLETPTQNKATEGEVMAMKKKRGRPRKYGADGSVLFNPIPISASMPPSGEFTLTSLDGVMLKRGRGRPIGSATKHQSFHRRNKFNQQLRSPAEFDSSDLATTGGVVACSSGANLTPHIITVAAGEDVTMKIISFSQKGSHAICILSANGVISNVTLRQPDSSGGTLTYEGRFELLSLSGCFKPSETGGARNLSGGMSVSLAGPDGRVVGGGLAGLLVAAGPVQVVVGSFMPSNPHSNKGADVVRAKKKKSDTESFSMNAPMATVGTGRSIVDIDESYGILRGGQQRSSGSPKGNNNMTSSRTADNNRSAPAVTNTTDVNGSQLPAVTGAGAGSEFQTSQVRIMGFHFTETEFQSCTGSKMFARLMAASAPFTDYQHALLAAKDIWLNKVDVNGWLESFAAHPEIGTNKPISQRCKDEQKSAFETATDSAMEELLEWNSRYKDKFRFIFIICASGRGMPEILDQLKKRFQNRPIVELDIAIGEEMKIIELRLAKLFKDDPVEKLKDVSGGGSIQHHRPRITTHVLDVSRGCPASGVEVYLEMWKDSHKCPSLINGDPSKWVLQGSSHTDRDGRSGPLMSIVDHTNPGFYRLSFNTGKYASSCFYPYVSIVFEVKERQRSEHFHVPLLFSPFSFSTYRGS